MGRCLRAMVCLGVAFVACTFASPAQLPERFPSPNDWDQWDYRLDGRDSRLEAARVTLSHPEVSLAGLLGDLSAQSGVELEAVPELAMVEVTAFGYASDLRSVMVSLCRMFNAYWVFPRGAEPEARRYVLAPHRAPGETLEDELDRFVEERDRALNRAIRPLREARMEKYFEAMELSADELLARYEKDDPWLCADLLDPWKRSLLEQLRALDAGERETLLTEGSLNLPISRFDADFREFLSRWRFDRSPGRGGSYPDPWNPPPTLYGSDEERWEHTLVSFDWSTDQVILEFSLAIPDDAIYRVDVVRSRDQSPLFPREDLARLGYREETADYEKAIKAEHRQWQDEVGEFASLRRRRQVERSVRPQLGDLSSPLLDLPVTFDSPKSQGMRLPELWETVARQCQVTALAHYRPLELYNPYRSPGSDATVSLGELLAWVQRKAGLHWRLDGHYVTTVETYPGENRWVPLSEEQLKEWRELVKPGEMVTDVEAAADAAAKLDYQQISALWLAIPETMGFVGHEMATYGSLDRSLREELTKGKELRVSELPSKAQKEFVDWLDACIPWAGEPDPTAAVVYRRPWVDAAGNEGFYIAVRYRAPGLPEVRRLLMVWPFD